MEKPLPQRLCPSPIPFAVSHFPRLAMPKRGTAVGTCRAFLGRCARLPQVLRSECPRGGAVQSENTRPVDSLGAGEANGDSWYLPGVSPMMRAIQRVAAEIAATDLPVLVAGERGTGKEVLALHIHRLSHRREQAFSKLNCATLSSDTLQRFLLRGGNGDGPVLSSHGGTVFLDEVG